MTLTEFLLARIAEDEAIARDCIKLAIGAWSHMLQIPYQQGWEAERATAHADQWHPHRVLAECAAKRAIIQEHPMMPAGALMTERHCAGYEEEAISRDWWPCPTLRALAIPYAEHPDYRQEWRL